MPLARKLAVMGALGLGVGALYPDESQASPLDKFIKKAGEKILQGEQSSAAEGLIGRLLPGFESPIKAITKGGGRVRNIIFEDGSAQQVDQNYLWHLKRETGTEEYKQKFEALTNPEEKYQHALKSLEHHVSRKPVENPEVKVGIDNVRKEHAYKMGELGYQKKALEPYGYVEPQGVWLPLHNAEVLQERGICKITKKEKR